MLDLHIVLVEVDYRELDLLHGELVAGANLGPIPKGMNAYGCRFFCLSTAVSAHTS
jgi:hypothetical protein